MFLTAGCRSMLLSKCSLYIGGRTWPLGLEGAGPGERGGTSSIRSFGLLETSFHAFIWMSCSFIIMTCSLVFDTHATLSD